jgi:hypothetical protein
MNFYNNSCFQQQWVIFHAASFGTFTTTMFQVEVLWIETPCSVMVRIPTFQRSVLPPSSGWSEDGGSTDLRNVGILQHYTASQPRWLWLEIFHVFILIVTSHETDLISWSRVLIEKLTVTQLVEKFWTFYGTKSFIAMFLMFLRSHHFSLY